VEIRRQSTFIVKGAASAGVMSNVAAHLRDMGLNNVGLWGFNRGSESEIHVIPEDPIKARTFLRDAVEKPVFLVFGNDRIGALCPVVDAISKAGINLEAMAALAVGGRLGICIWPQDGDAERVAKALGL